jgi:hypothetical protein
MGILPQVIVPPESSRSDVLQGVEHLNIFHILTRII